jgi:hypothetical protein
MSAERRDELSGPLPVKLPDLARVAQEREEPEDADTS